MIFGGRRKSDRWVAYLFIALMILLGVFVIYTSVQQYWAERDRERIIESLERQNTDLLCFADNTRAFELSVADYLLAQNKAATPDDPEATQRRRDLEAVHDQLQAAKQLCFPEGKDPPFGPPTTTR